MRAILALVCAIFLVLLAYTDGAKGDIVESNKEHTKKLFDEQNAQKRSKQTSIQERMNEEKQDLDGEKESINHGPISLPDLCAELGCGEGEECIIEEGKARCQCIKSCPLESNFRNNVCTNANVTFNSECEFHRQECLCAEESPICLDKSVLDMHLDYFGACVAIKPCTKEELNNFPTRMAEWLKSVMESLDVRQELSVHYSDLHRRSRRSSNPLIVPAIWEFCNIDSSHDRILSRSEFFPLIAPLKALEHCIGDFLDLADGDSNGEITLKEWGMALNIQEDEIEDICESIPEKK